MELESEKRKIEEQLEAERNLGLEKDRLLERSKKAESDLADDILVLQQDLETVDGQLDRAMALQKETEERYRVAQAKYEEAAARLQILESSEVSWKAREQELLASIQRTEAELTALTTARTALEKSQEDLQHKLAEKGEDIARVRDRMDATIAELEGKLVQETRARYVKLLHL